jgi:hypothetical protein
MNAIYLFLIRNDVWIYILSALAIVWYFSELLKSRSILRRARFGLERERGLRIRNKALTLLAIFSAIIAIVIYVNVEIAETLPPEMLAPATFTPDIFATPLSSPTPLGSPTAILPSPTPPFAPTVTLRSPPGGVPQLSPTPLSTPPPGGAPPVSGPTATVRPPQATIEPPGTGVGCIPAVNISSPASGSVVSGFVSFVGVASDPNFAFYRLEANGPETNNTWASILGETADQQVLGGVLGGASMGDWMLGDYAFRLTVVDLSSSVVGQCIIQLTLGAEE